MTSAAEPLQGLSFAEYLAFEERSEQRHELVGGRVYAMAGGSERHDLLAGLIYEALAPGARALGCRPFTANRKLTVATASYYPDVLVVCGPAAHRLHEDRAAVVVEVLSPSTQDVDRREKAAAYGGLADLSVYVLADPERRRLEVARRGEAGLTWEVVGAGEVLTTPYGLLDVDALHDALDAAATT